eukprot:13640095-Alexandrium_andersonii.AAC.1
MSTLKKVGVLYFTNAMGGSIPGIMGQDEEGQRFLPWRTSLIPTFVESAKLYIEFPREQTQFYVRILLDMALEFNLELNG